MAQIKERVWAKLIFDERHEQHVLKFIADEQDVTLDMLIEQCP